MRNEDWPGHLPRGEGKAEDHRGNFSGGRGKAEDGELLFEAEDEELKPPGVTSQEAEARPRTGSHCLGLKMRNQDH